MNYDEQIQLIKHWIDEQDEGEEITRFVISDYGDDGYEVIMQFTTEYTTIRYCIFMDTMFREKSGTPFLEQFKQKVKVTINTYVKGMKDFVKTL
jgi:hypothetical protein